MAYTISVMKTTTFIEQNAIRRDCIRRIESALSLNYVSDTTKLQWVKEELQTLQEAIDAIEAEEDKSDPFVDEVKA